MFMLFGMSFCAVSLAVVWGTTLERIKFSSYVIYAVFFGALIYPMVAHSVYGGGLLSDIGGKPGNGLRRFVRSPSDRCYRWPRGAALARRTQRQVRRGRFRPGDPRSLDAAGRPRRDHPVDRLVRIQRRLDLRHRRRDSSPK